MKDVIKLVSFITYLILLFYISNYLVLGILVLINILVVFYGRLDIKALGKKLLILFPFVIFTVIINVFFSGCQYAVLIGVRLIIAYTITYIFSNSMSINQLANAMGKIIYPFKIFGVDMKQITLIIAISISILPNMLEEIQEKMNSLKAKAFKFKLNHGVIILKPIFISILKRSNEFGNALLSKGYQEDS